MSDFPSIAFQSALTIEGIFFGLLGILYGTITSMSFDRPENWSQIVALVRRASLFFVLLITLNAIIVIVSLFLMNISGVGNIILAILFVVIVIAMVIVGFYWVYIMP